MQPQWGKRTHSYNISMCIYQKPVVDRVMLFPRMRRKAYLCNMGEEGGMLPAVRGRGLAPSRVSELGEMIWGSLEVSKDMGTRRRFLLTCLPPSTKLSSTTDLRPSFQYSLVTGSPEPQQTKSCNFEYSHQETCTPVQILAHSRTFRCRAE